MSFPAISKLNPPSSASISPSNPGEQLLAQKHLSNRKGREWANQLTTYFKEMEDVFKEIIMTKKQDRNKVISACQAAKTVQTNKEKVLDCLLKRTWEEYDLLDLTIWLGSTNAQFFYIPTDLHVKIERKYSNHLIHLIVSKLSESNNPSNDCFFTVMHGELALSFGRSERQWAIVDLLNISQPSSPFHAITWERQLTADSSYCVLTKYCEASNKLIPVRAPFISLQFFSRMDDLSTYQATLKEVSQSMEMDPTKVPF